MSLLQTILPARLGTPVRAKAAPDRLIAGDPDFLTWALNSSRDGEVRTGIWEATPGEMRRSRARASSSATSSTA